MRSGVRETPRRTDLGDLLAKVPAKHRARVSKDIDMLRRRGVGSLERLLALVADEDAPAEVRAVGCDVLGHLGRKRAAGALLAAIQSPDPVLRWEAAKALETLNSKRSVTVLLELLQGAEQPETRQAAAYVLGFLHDPRAVKTLIAVLGCADEDPVVRSQAAEALGYLGDRAASPALREGLSDPSADVRFWCVFALTLVEGADAIPVLERVAQMDHALVPEFRRTVSDEARQMIDHVRGGGYVPSAGRS